MLFKRRPVIVRKGEKTKVLSTFSNSLDMSYTFTAEPVSKSDRVGGVVEVRGSNWLFPKAPRQQALERENTVAKGIWDTFFSVYVQPDCDVTVTRTGFSLGRFTKLSIVAALIISVVIFIVIFSYFI